MLHVILLILKILGILLLACLALFLLVLYAVLFVGVSYRLKAEREEEHFLVSARVAWLFRIVTVHFLMDEKTGLSPVLNVRLFGRSVWRILGEEEPKRFGKISKKKRRRRRKQKQPEREKKEKEPAGEEPVIHAEEKKPHPAPESPRAEQKKTTPLENKEGRKQKQEQPSFFAKLLRKITGVIRKICDKIRKIRGKITEVGKAFQKLKKRKDDFVEFWRLEEHRRARGALLEEGRYLWKKSKPRKLIGQILFGFSDPAHTGLCMGALSMLCAFYPRKFQVIPDFDQAILKGDVKLRGKIRCYVFVKILIRIYFNKDIRHMYRHWQEL